MINLWKKFTPAKKIYTGTARGARDKYQVCGTLFLTSVASNFKATLAPKRDPLKFKACDLVYFSSTNQYIEVQYKHREFARSKFYWYG